MLHNSKFCHLCAQCADTRLIISSSAGQLQQWKWRWRRRPPHGGRRWRLLCWTQAWAYCTPYLGAARAARPRQSLPIQNKLHAGAAVAKAAAAAKAVAPSRRAVMRLGRPDDLLRSAEARPAVVGGTQVRCQAAGALAPSARSNPGRGSQAEVVPGQVMRRAGGPRRRVGRGLSERRCRRLPARLLEGLWTRQLDV